VDAFEHWPLEMDEVVLVVGVPLADGEDILAHVLEEDLDHDEDVVVPLGIELHDLLVVAFLVQVELLLAPFLELVVEALEHPHYGGVGHH
jgi:hypothetical protein